MTRSCLAFNRCGRCISRTTATSLPVDKTSCSALKNSPSETATRTDHRAAWSYRPGGQRSTRRSPTRGARPRRARGADERPERCHHRSGCPWCSQPTPPQGARTSPRRRGAVPSSDAATSRPQARCAGRPTTRHPTPDRLHRTRQVHRSPARGPPTQRSSTRHPAGADTTRTPEAADNTPTPRRDDAAPTEDRDPLPSPADHTANTAARPSTTGHAGTRSPNRRRSPSRHQTKRYDSNRSRPRHP